MVVILCKHKPRGQHLHGNNSTPRSSPEITPITPSTFVLEGTFVTFYALSAITVVFLFFIRPPGSKWTTWPWWMYVSQLPALYCVEWWPLCIQVLLCILEEFQNFLISWENVVWFCLGQSFVYSCLAECYVQLQASHIAGKIVNNRICFSNNKL